MLTRDQDIKVQDALECFHCVHSCPAQLVLTFPACLVDEAVCTTLAPEAALLKHSHNHNPESHFPLRHVPLIHDVTRRVPSPESVPKPELNVHCKHNLSSHPNKTLQIYTAKSLKEGSRATLRPEYYPI